MKELVFEKYHGLGNDYLVYDCIKNNFVLTEGIIKRICDRNFGLGSDGILVGPIYKDNTIGVRIFNPDGSIAEKSGNGVRIFSKFLKDKGYIKEESFNLKTLGGMVSVKYLNDNGTLMKVSMGKLSFSSTDIGAVGLGEEVIDKEIVFGSKNYRCTCVSIGNPHCVILMNKVSKEAVCEIGKYSEGAKYFTNKINTQIVEVLDRNNIRIEIFERGAGYTLASGSSSCAAAGAMYKLGLVDSDITVHMQGGNLKINIDSDMNVFMTGCVSRVGTMILSEEFPLMNN